jgi:hypothetical protein
LMYPNGLRFGKGGNRDDLEGVILADSQIAEGTGLREQFGDGKVEIMGVPKNGGFVS